MRLVFACFVLLFQSCVTTSATSAPEGTSTVTEEPTPAPVARPKVQARRSETFTSSGAAIAPRPAERVEPQPVADPVAAALRKRGLLTASAPSRQDLQAALRAFQKSQGLAETGFADQLTLKKLQQ